MALLIVGVGLAASLHDAVAQPKDRLIAYPAPDGAALNSDFDVRVRTPGGEWRDLPTYLVKVDAVRKTDHSPENSSVAYFDCSGTVQVSVTFNHRPIQSARVRPLSYAIEPEVEGSRLTFQLSQPRNLSIEVIQRYDDSRKVKNVVFENLVINGLPISDDMEKPAWFKTSDMARFFVGEHVEGIRFLTKD